MVFQLYLPHCRHLKEKRHYLQAIKARLQSRLNVSVAEVAFQEQWQRSTLAVVWVAGDGSGLDSLAQKIESVVFKPGEVEVLDVQRTTY